MQINEIKNKLSANIVSVVIVISGLVLVIGGFLFSYYHQRTTPENYKAKTTDCSTQVSEYAVESGVTDVFPVGTKLKIEYGYYKCHPASRGDVVMLKVTGRDLPLLETIRMIPGDIYEVRESKNQRYRVYVNHRVLKNSKGEEYDYSVNRVSMLRLYENNFKKGIREDVYFAFFEDPTGGFDSTRLGAITPEVMIGKVLTGSEGAVESVPQTDKNEEPQKEESQDVGIKEEKPKTQPPTKKVLNKKDTAKESSAQEIKSKKAVKDGKK